MNLLPHSSGSRPRTACEITPDNVLAARSEDAAGPVSGGARVTLPPGAVLPSLKPGNLPDRVAVIAAVRRALESLGVRPNSRGADLTLIIPDAATRVLLLDFDTFPTKLTEALPIVRFRLKKLLPFEADDAMVSYQVMSSTRSLVRVLAVATPRDVLGEYETAVREAGYEPGAVLPSTLAALPGVPAGEPALLINSNHLGVTTAILDRDSLLLHRTVDLQGGMAAIPASLPPALFEGALSHTRPPEADSQAPFAATANGTHGMNEYADRLASEEAVQNGGGLSGMPEPPAFGEPTRRFASAEASGDGRPESDANSILVTPDSMRSLVGSEAELTLLAAAALGDEPPAADPFASDPDEASRSASLQEEIAQAVSVAMAYFEDTLASEPRQLWNAGFMPAEAMAQLLRRNGLIGAMGLEVRELVSPSLLEASVTVPRHLLAGTVGALRG